jgi:hypothetical protein
MNTNPQYYGLSPKIQLKEIGKNKLGIVKVLKSRIIRKDAEKIVAIASQIKSINPELEITLICTHNICSKSIMLLKNERVAIELID